MRWRRGSWTVLLAMALLTGGVRGSEPTLVARWNFDSEETPELVAHGGIVRDEPGPAAPEFPDFATDNKAIRFDGQGGRLTLEDPGPESPFDFTNGDAITIEAWVRVNRLRDGQPMYIIGKGRTGSPHFPRDNQNWALRIVGSQGAARLSFLFATTPTSGNAHWHRWTSAASFEPAVGWHYVAVSYQFGEPESIRGWIDGEPTDGTWDMGGATREPPVVDEDAIWIGSSQGGSAGNSFAGALDSLAIYRHRATDEQMASRFRRVGGPRVILPRPETMPELGELPDGKVLVTIAENYPSHERWLNEGEEEPTETSRWLGEEFLLPRIPLRYDDWGIRASWQAPLLVRLAADVELPDGRQKFLVRARGLSRLWVDGAIVARTEPMTGQPPNGEEPITPIAEPPLPGVRVKGYRQQEVFGELDVAAKNGTRRCRVVWELLVGGPGYRTEIGEICVAIQTEDGQSYDVLRPADAQGSLASLPLTDDAVEPKLALIEASLAANDDRTRRQAAQSQDAYWSARHEAARQWAREHPAPPVPQPASGESLHPIDAFIQAKLSAALHASTESARDAEHFHERVMPILREHCFRCHGEKDRGGLRLNTHVAALRGGDSGLPAIVPGDPGASELIARIRSDDESVRMPPTGSLSDEQIETLERWIQSGAAWPPPRVHPDKVALAPLLDDDAFLRRLYFDTIGLPPDADAVRAFRADTDPRKRERWIARLVDDERLVDHWMSWWQDLLAENPTIINASLNSTGPFRWFLLEALRDRKPLDRLVTELIMMRGSPHEGGSAGFGLAAENDAPMAAKAHILASAFLGIELQCARCHDSPYHSTTQRDLYSLAAMLERKAVTVPGSSNVPAEFFDQTDREPLIQVTLKPGEPIEPVWPFADIVEFADTSELDALLRQPDDPRERLAALITAPQNTRFARVVVNRVWKRLLGAGIVEPVHDWEGRSASHPELLDWLAHQLITHGYDLRHIIQLILTSETYQREPVGRNLAAAPESRFFNAPDRRRLSAEQIVDALYAATGQPIDVEELTFVHDGRRPVSNRLTLGKPMRAWMFASLANERDRPSLALPRARIVADVLEAFGWTGSRQTPIVDREMDPNVLQPGILANGTLTQNLLRAAHGSLLAQLAVDASSPEALIDELFLRFLGRWPTADERAAFSGALADGFAERIVPTAEREEPTTLPPLPLVTWFNHLQAEANSIQLEVERRVRLGPPVDPRLRPVWREAYEDVLWSLVVHHEFVWLP